LSKGQRKERKEEGVEVGCCGASSEFDFARILNLLLLVLHLSLRLRIGIPVEFEVMVQRELVEWKDMFCFFGATTHKTQQFYICFWFLFLLSQKVSLGNLKYNGSHVLLR